MPTGKEDVLQALIDAYLMEKGTSEFYAEAARRAVIKDARKMFISLSAWEAEHMDYIQYLYQAITEDRDIRGFEEFRSKSRAPLTEGGIPAKDLAARMEARPFTDDIQAVDIALEIEDRAYALYGRLSGSALDANARVVFREMMGQELRHMDYLKEVRSKIAA